MKTYTETGKILRHLNYKDEEVERFDQLAFHLYSIPLNERKELLSVLAWQFTLLSMKEDIMKIDKVWNDMDDSEK